MASLCTRFAEWVRSPFSAVVTFQKQFVGDVTEKMKHQKEKLDRRIREQQQRAIERKLDELEEKYLCCVCRRPGEAREEEEHIYETFSMINVPPTQTIMDAVQEVEEVSEEKECEYFSQSRHFRKQQHQQEMKKHTISSTYDDIDDVDEFNKEQKVKRSKSRVDKPSKSNTQHTKWEHETDNSELFANSQCNAHYEHNRIKNDDDDGDVVVVRDGNGDIDNSYQHKSHAADAILDNHDKTNWTPSTSGKAAYSPHTNIAPQDVIDPSTVSRRDIQHMLYKIRHAILNKEAHVKRKAVVVHRDRGLMKIDEAEIDLFSLFFQRPVHGYLCASCYTSARRRLDTLTRQVQLILFKANHPLLRKVTKIEMEEELRRGRATLPALLIGPPSLPSFKTETETETHEEEEQQSEEEYDIAQENKETDQNEELLKQYDHASQKTTPTTLNGSTRHQNNIAMHNPERVNYNGEEDDSNSMNNEDGLNGNVMAMGQLSDSVIYALRSYVKCGVCQRRYSCFFIRPSVLFICQFCCARDRFYRDHAICINDELMPLDCVHLLTDLSHYYYHIHHDPSRHPRHHQQQEPQENSSSENHMPHSPMKKIASTDLFGPVNEDNLFECLPPLNSTTAINIVPVYDDTLHRDDPRTIVGQTTVSLFAGRKLEPATNSNTAHIDLFAEHVKQNANQINNNNSNTNQDSDSSNDKNNINNINNGHILDDLFN